MSRPDTNVDAAALLVVTEAELTWLEKAAKAELFGGSTALKARFPEATLQLVSAVRADRRRIEALETALREIEALGRNDSARLRNIARAALEGTPP